MVYKDLKPLAHAQNAFAHYTEYRDHPFEGSNKQDLEEAKVAALISIAESLATRVESGNFEDMP